MCHQRYLKYLSDGIFYYKIYGTNILDEKINGIIKQNTTKHNVYYLNIVIYNIESELLDHYYIILYNI